MRHTLSYRKTPEFGINIGHRHFGFFAGFFDIAYNLINHKLIVVFKAQRVFDGKSSANIDRV